MYHLEWQAIQNNSVLQHGSRWIRQIAKCEEPVGRHLCRDVEIFSKHKNLFVRWRRTANGYVISEPAKSDEPK